MNRYRIVTIRESELNSVLINEWRSLWEKSTIANFYNTYEWITICKSAYPRKSIFILFCYYHSELVAVFPFSKYLHFGIGVLGSVGNKILVNDSILMAEYDTKILKALINHLTINNSHIFIKKINSKTAQLLRILYPKALISLMSANPCLNLTKDLNYQYSHKAVKQIRVILNKCQNHLSFKFLSLKKDLEQNLTTIFKIDQNSSKKEKSMDIFSKDENIRIFNNYVQLGNKYVRIGILYYDNQPISYIFGFLYKNIFSAHQTSFLYSYRDIKPGRLMFYLLNQYLKNIGVNLIDFGGGMSRYKREFTQEYQVHYDFYLSKNTFVLLWWKLINLARRINQILFPVPNTRDNEYLFKLFSINQFYEH